MDGNEKTQIHPPHKKSVLIVFTSLVLLGIVWNSYHAYQVFKSTAERSIRMESVRGTITYLDEVLTMSVRMAAATGDLAWEKRYRQYEPKLDEAIKEATRFLPSDRQKNTTTLQTDGANNRLIKMENKAFSLVRQGKTEEAKVILFSEAYDREKNLYQEGMVKFESVLKEMVDDSLASTKLRSVLTIAFSFMAGMILFVFMAFIARPARLRDEIAKSKRTELELRDNQALFSGILGMSGEAVVSIDESQRVILFNRGAENIFGYEQDEIMGKPIELLIPGGFRQNHSGHAKEFAASQTVSHVMVMSPEVIGLRKNSEEFPVEASFVKLFIKGRMVFTAILRDVSERRRAEEALKINEEKLRLITDAVPSAVYRYSLDKRGTRKFLFVSRFAETLFGVPSEEILNNFRLVWKLVLPEDVEALVQSIKISEETLKPWTHEFKIGDAQGNLKWIQGHSIPEKLQADGTIICNGVLTDITLRKQAERRLNTEHAVTRVLAESPDLDEALQKIIQVICENLDWQEGAVWSVDAKADVLRCADIWHKPSESLKEFIDATRRAAFKRGIGLPGRIWESLKPVWILDIAKDSSFPRAPFAARADLHSAFGFPILFENQFIGVMEFFTSEIRSPDDDLFHMMNAIGVQIGQFMRQKNLGEQLVQTQKLESIGKLTGGIAHDFNNLLTVINGYAGLIMESLAPDDLLRADLEEIFKAGKRAQILTNQLLSFSRRQVIKPELVDLRSLVTNLDKMLRRLLGVNIEMVMLADDSLKKVKLDPSQMEQVIVNLAVNARDAMSDKGKIVFQMTNRILNETDVKSHPGLKPGAYVQLSVTDTGLGISDEVRSHLFEPFFTTKPKGKGTGLGLATCYGIIKQMEGSIAVQSELGKGSTFEIFLPAVTEPAAGDKEKEKEKEALPSRSETILLVEDESMVRNFCARALSRHGYTLFVAQNGVEAINLFEELTRKHIKIDLLLTDVVMPQMGGKEAADRIKKIQPDLKVLFMSGYMNDPLNMPGSDIEFIPKPFSFLALLEKVHGVLG